ncbi:MAG: hypothetical protein KKF67_01015 [Nanoarchaeota archaeon]|nr:hypothetical protein [Nanoarchaeota archaeon]
MIYELARKLYGKLSHQRESELVLCPEGLCFNVVNSNRNLDGNSQQFNQKRFYPFYGADSNRRHTLKINNKKSRTEIDYIITKEKSRRWEKRHHKSSW